MTAKVPLPVSPTVLPTFHQGSLIGRYIANFPTGVVRLTQTHRTLKQDPEGFINFQTVDVLALEVEQETYSLLS